VTNRSETRCTSVTTHHISSFVPSKKPLTSQYFVEFRDQNFLRYFSCWSLSSIRTPMLIQWWLEHTKTNQMHFRLERCLERTETSLLHFIRGSVWKVTSFFCSFVNQLRFWWMGCSLHLYSINYHSWMSNSAPIARERLGTAVCRGQFSFYRHIQRR